MNLMADQLRSHLISLYCGLYGCSAAKTTQMSAFKVATQRTVHVQRAAAIKLAVVDATATYSAHSTAVS